MYYVTWTLKTLIDALSMMLVLSVVTIFYGFLGTYFLLVTLLCIPFWAMGEIYGHEKSKMGPTGKS